MKEELHAAKGASRKKEAIGWGRADARSIATPAASPPRYPMPAANEGLLLSPLPTNCSALIVECSRHELPTWVSSLASSRVTNEIGRNRQESEGHSFQLDAPITPSLCAHTPLLLPVARILGYITWPKDALKEQQQQQRDSRAMKGQLTCRMAGDPWRPSVPRISPHLQAPDALWMASFRDSCMRSWA